MLATLQPGLKYQLKFVVPETKTVPDLFPESPEFLASPRVFATGYMVGFLEWACKAAIAPYLDAPAEHSVGTHIDMTHEGATPPGVEITADIELVAIEGRKLSFTIVARDAEEILARGTHERFVINRAKFDAKVEDKRARLSGNQPRKST